MKVVWTARARSRLQEIHDRIALDQPVNAARWTGRVLERGEQIGDQPRSGRMVPEYGRETIREVFEGAYRIVYRIRSQRVDVITVHHGARRLPSIKRL